MLCAFLPLFLKKKKKRGSGLWGSSFNPHLAPFLGGPVTQYQVICLAAGSPERHCWEHPSWNTGWGSVWIWKSTAALCLGDKWTRPSMRCVLSVLVDVRSCVFPILDSWFLHCCVRAWVEQLAARFGFWQWESTRTLVLICGGFSHKQVSFSD